MPFGYIPLRLIFGFVEDDLVRRSGLLGTDLLFLLLLVGAVIGFVAQRKGWGSPR